ncbi:MAG: type II secretion system F family protein [Lachnospiraceae bacterium]|nr:type II secretion system F family protein [Lachnospiraceae bacterium]
MLNNSELATFFRQLGMLVHSGISTLEGIEIIRDDLTDLKAQKLLTDIHGSLALQQEFSEVLNETGEFPKYAVDMIRIGNYSGKLDEVLAALAIYYEREEQISSNIRSAITYPAIMIFMLMIVIGVLVARVLPVFQDVYQQLGADLTGPARGLMHLSGVLQSILPQIIIVLLLIIIALFFVLRKKSTLFSKSFVKGKLSQSIAVGRFASGMYLTLSSGLDTDESLKMTGSLTDHPVIQTKIQTCQTNLDAGKSFAEAISIADIFNHTQNRMIHIGLRSGALDQVMENIAKQCNDETDGKIQHLLSILEPTLVAILALIVGIILLSVMLPLMGIMANIGL